MGSLVRRDLFAGIQSSHKGHVIFLITHCIVVVHHINVYIRIWVMALGNRIVCRNENKLKIKIRSLRKGGH